MPRLEDQILVNALTLNRMREDAMRSAFENRHASEAKRRLDWNSYWNLYRALFFPGGEEGWAALMARESASVDAALAFLGAAPHFFGSGYMMETIWQGLKRMPINRAQEQRLEDIALARLQPPARRDFWDMARCMRFRGTPRFWDKIAALAQAHGHDARGTRAQWLLLARANHPVQRWLGEELRRRAQGQAHDFKFARQLSPAAMEQDRS